MGRVFTWLCEKVAEDLQRKGYVGKTIGIKLRYDDFKTATRDQTVDAFTADAATIRRVAGLCLKRVPLDRKLRLLGVRVGGLLKQDELLDLERNGPKAQVLPPQNAIDSGAMTGQLF